MCAEQYETHTTLAKVQAHMQQLSEVLRTTLYLVAVEGHSYQEAADIMEVPVGTIMSRLARARQQLSLAL
jgi:RNA polymerase sigma-70 factor (ECF subfamily)